MLPAETDGGTTECVLQALRAPTEAITGASRRAARAHAATHAGARCARTRQGRVSGLEPDACFRHLVGFARLEKVLL